MEEPARLTAVLTSALLRLTTLPVERARPTLQSLGVDDTAATERYVRELTADPLVREAIAVSSPSLTHTLDALHAGRPVEPARVRRAARAVTSYLLRMTTRPTPFGLMAGVARARFGPRAVARLGNDHRKGVRADAGWLAEVVRRRESDPAIVRRLRVVRNNLCTVRGDRLVLTYVSGADDVDGKPAREVSVRRTPLVREADRLADRPIRFGDLVDQLCQAFEQASPDKVEPVLLQLIERQLLLTELTPPPGAKDPLEHVLGHLPGDPELTRARDAIHAYAAEPSGAGLPAWHRAGRSGREPHVDLAFDAEVTLPVPVAAEVERAATILTRLAPPDQTPAYLRHYHLAFLERYGTTQLIPLLELLDPVSGLDAPAGYELPRSSRPDPPAELDDATPPPKDRDRVLGGLAQQAALDGADEVVLDDATLDLLAYDDSRVPGELELGVEVVAESLAAMDAGDFQVVVGGLLLSPRAGALGGRFAYLLDGIELGPPDPPGAVTAQVEFQPARAGLANLARVPRTLDHTIAAGVFADSADPTVLGIDELLVGADDRRFYLWSERLGMEVVPATFHMLDSRRLAPNAVRFVRELAAARQRGCRAFDWGPVDEVLPFLPRVRYGRLVLSPASWRPDPALADPALPEEAWLERFQAWRKRWRVPARAYLTVVDHRVGLDLDAPPHQALLRHELHRRPDAKLVEAPAGGRLGTGWLGGHAHELVVTLRSSHPSPVRDAPAARSGRRRHYPGGEWTYAKLYAPQSRHRHLIAHSLDALRNALPDSVDRWFFVRYLDPEPHVRIRVHGEVLPLLHDWAASLCEANLAQRLVLDTYEPEVERYGGLDALEAAERAFHADSEAAIATLRLAHPLPMRLLVAAGMADLATAFGEPDWRNRFLEAYPKDASHAAFQAVRRQALATIVDRKVDPALAAIWQRRSGAIRAYGEVVRAIRAGGVSPLGSLLHMHHNRLAGVDPELEREAYAVLRGALQARLDRDRATR
ncbi:lantibiotic dehydratase [Flindersiella endophytica]